MSFHQPSPPPARTIPSIPVRFEFRVEILAARARRKRGKERKMAISAGSAPPPPSPVPLGTSGGVVETQKQCYRSPHRKFFVRKNRSSAFPGPLLSPRPLVRRRGGGFFFIRGWTRLAAARGRPFERYPKGWSVRGRGWLQLISTPSLTPPPSWRGNTNTETTACKLVERVKKVKKKKKEK